MWRLEDMKWIGRASLRGKTGGVFEAGGYVMSSRGKFTGGYGAEIFRLVRVYAVRLGAAAVMASARDRARAAVLEQAGFRIVSASPPHHAKRPRGYIQLRLEWRP